MADQKEITLRQGDATPKDIVLYDLPVATPSAGTTVYLYQGDATAKDVILRDPTTLQISGAVAYTLVCNAGAYTYSGQSAELTVARNLALSAGAYSYAGSDATLNYVAGTPAVNYTLELATGTYSYTGNDIEFTYVSGQTVKTGGKGDNPKNRSIYKPTGLVEVKKKKKQEQQIVSEVIAAKQQPINVSQVVDIKTPPIAIALSSLVHQQPVIATSNRNKKALIALLLAA